MSHWFLNKQKQVQIICFSKERRKIKLKIKCPKMSKLDLNSNKKDFLM